ncbi:formylglycine-generating enzyme family protein [Moraxella marmotae]|uniref:formylglycine-generating enzyme family protein n=1 Tax=Moraxella marmotae TaxID=3344520 RepID=UPI0035F4A268
MITAAAMAAFFSANAYAATKQVKISGGIYRPLYLSKDSPKVAVKPFSLDVLPVTNREFQSFLQKNPNYARGKIAPIFADTGYLKHWQKTSTGFVPKAADMNKPVTNISWYAANQYCKAQGKRLPTVEEWEYVARASAKNKDGSREKGYNQRILDWYAKSASSSYQMSEVGQSPANYWGVKDMHGLIWEWTENFNSALVSGESRADSQLNQTMFCGSGAAGAADPSDYAAFMRYAFRSSLTAKYTVGSLGFRCASS